MCTVYSTVYSTEVLPKYTFCASVHFIYLMTEPPHQWPYVLECVQSNAVECKKIPVHSQVKAKEGNIFTVRRI